MIYYYRNTMTSETHENRYTGRVKWFNQKKGFGFITVNEGELQGHDIFAHHSDISVQKEQYKYLVQGEYTTFILSDVDTVDNQEDHKYTMKAVDIKGVCGGELMCETRNSQREQREKYRREHKDDHHNHGTTHNKRHTHQHRRKQYGRHRQNESQYRQHKPRQQYGRKRQTSQNVVLVDKNGTEWVMKNKD